MSSAQLEGEVDRARSRRGHHALESESRCCAPQFTLDGTDRLGARVRDEPRPLRDAAQRPPRRRPGLHARAGRATTSACSTRRYDVTDLVQRGPNAIGATLGDGWYRGRLAWDEQAQHRTATARRAARADRRALHRRPRAGHRDRRAVEGVDRPDPRRPTSTTARPTTRGSRSPGWSRPGFDDAEWTAVATSRDRPMATRRAGGSAGPAHRGDQAASRSSTRRPARRCSTSGRTWSGWVRLQVAGPAGTTVTLAARRGARQGRQLLHGEPARRAGRPTRTRSRAAARRSSSRTSPSTASATSTVDGFPGTPTPEAITGIVVHSDMPRTGDVRDVRRAGQPAAAQHRLGAEGQLRRRADRLPAARRAARLDGRRAGVLAHRRVQHGRRRLLHEVAAATSPPISSRTARCPSHPRRRSARGQADGTSSRRLGATRRVIVPWTMYLALRRHAAPREAVPEHARVGRVHAQARGRRLLWNSGFHFGDWLAFATTRADYPGATTDKDLIATAFFAHSTDLLARTARSRSARRTTRARYRELLRAHQEPRSDAEYVTPTGRVGVEHADGVRARAAVRPAARRAARDARPSGSPRTCAQRTHLTTGFLGTPYLCHVLTRYGYLDEAYLLLLNERSIRRGSTP